MLDGERLLHAKNPASRGEKDNRRLLGITAPGPTFEIFSFFDPLGKDGGGFSIISDFSTDWKSGAIGKRTTKSTHFQFAGQFSFKQNDLLPPATARHMLFWKPKKQKLSDLREELTLPLDEAKKRAKILVVDDDPTAFPVDLLRAEGYNVQQWERLTNLRNLEQGQFDIIVLDIYNICDEDLSKTDGLGVLEHLKQVNPAQIVVAFSGKKFDLKHEKFWRIADDYLGKPTDMLVAKAKLDALLREKFTADHYWTQLTAYLRARGVDAAAIEKLESALATAATKKQPLTESDIGTLLRNGKDIISTAWIIVQVILRFAGTP